jgi:hypothetical protein
LDGDAVRALTLHTRFGYAQRIDAIYPSSAVMFCLNRKSWRCLT